MPAFCFDCFEPLVNFIHPLKWKESRKKPRRFACKWKSIPFSSDCDFSLLLLNPFSQGQRVGWSWHCVFHCSWMCGKKCLLSVFCDTKCIQCHSRGLICRIIEEEQLLILPIIIHTFEGHMAMAMCQLLNWIFSKEFRGGGVHSFLHSLT